MDKYLYVQQTGQNKFINEYILMDVNSTISIGRIIDENEKEDEVEFHKVVIFMPDGKLTFSVARIVEVVTTECVYDLEKDINLVDLTHL